MTSREDASEVAQPIRAFLEGAGGEWDWDDFTSCSLQDPQLDNIRKRAGAVELPGGPRNTPRLNGLQKRPSGWRGPNVRFRPIADISAWPDNSACLNQVYSLPRSNAGD